MQSEINHRKAFSTKGKNPRTITEEEPEKVPAALADNILDDASLPNRSPSAPMIERYVTRINNHIARVAANLEKVASHPDFFHLAVELNQRASTHDESKFSPDENDPFVWLTEFHRCRREKLTFKYPPGVEDQIKLAISHHHICNSHHPEAHDNLNTMTDPDIIEMVCDWTAMSQEFGQNGGSARGWADQHIGSRWEFNKNRTKLIYRVIDVLDAS